MGRIYRARWLVIWVGVIAACAAAGGVAAEPGAALLGVADGKADATAVLREALAREHVVQLPPGEFRITAPLRLESGQGLTGLGTIVVDFDTLVNDAQTTKGWARDFSAPANAALYINGDNVRIEGIGIRKIFVEGSYGTGIASGNDRRIKNVLIRGVEISGYSARYGIHLLNADDFEISNCYIHDMMMNGSSDMIRDSPAGLRAAYSTRGVIRGNRIIRIEVGPAGLESISPLMPKYGPQGYQADNITLTKCDYLAVSDNILAVSGEGIDMQGCRHCSVTGNTMDTLWHFGLKVIYDTQYCTFSGNTIRDCALGGIVVSSSEVCGGNTLVGNTIVNTGCGRFASEYKPYKNWNPIAIELELGERNGAGVEGVKAEGAGPEGPGMHNVLIGNIIYDDQAEPTCKYGIVEKKPDAREPHANLISGNLIRGMTVKDYGTNSPVVR